MTDIDTQCFRLDAHSPSSDGCAICAAEVIELKKHKPDNGPWTISKDGRSIYSDDFHHDVTLNINGDFYDDDVRRQYAQHIADILNDAIFRRTN